jgi:hypothetical protein
MSSLFILAYFLYYISLLSGHNTDALTEAEFSMFSINDFCKLRNKVLESNISPLVAVFNPHRRIYIGSSNKNISGFDANTYLQLDVSKSEHFAKYFSPRVLMFSTQNTLLSIFHTAIVYVHSSYSTNIWNLHA